MMVQRQTGKIVGSDMWTDLAVIEIDAKLVKTVIEFGDSDALKRGETVIAIGNPLGLGFSGSVTVGVVSGKIVRFQLISMKMAQWTGLQMSCKLTPPLIQVTPEAH